MSFADGDLRALERPGLEFGTIEIGRRSSSHGMIVRIEGLTSGVQWRALLEQAFDLAGRSTPVRPHDAGWWCGVVCAAALAAGLSPAVLRTFQSGEPTGKHVWMVLEPQRMLEVAPHWPLVKIAPTMPWLDLRGETCLAHGPSDLELTQYAERMGARAVDTVALREMFDLGVLEWSRPHEVSGQRVVQRAR